MSQAVLLLLVAIIVAIGANVSIIPCAENAIAIAATIFAVTGVTIIATVKAAVVGQLQLPLVVLGSYGETATQAGDENV